MCVGCLLFRTHKYCLRPVWMFLHTDKSSPKWLMTAIFPRFSPIRAPPRHKGRTSCYWTGQSDVWTETVLSNDSDCRLITRIQKTNQTAINIQLVIFLPQCLFLLPFFLAPVSERC